MGKQFVVPAAIAATALLYGIRQRKQRSRGVQPIILTNKDGVEVHILPVGAVIQRLIIPVNGRKIDVVLGFNKAATYVSNQKCLLWPEEQHWCPSGLGCR
eukprot:GHRR01034456.1.p1 GENE.GHRR01034456.1~~GHRR01034456.1.p1  ORF type:complete len:100 (+),score=12.11 GHRR01034456.1:235-534(+)